MFRRPDRLIIAQYEAPKDLSLIAAAELLGDSKRAIAAQVVDFAVRGIVTISRDKRKGKDGKPGFSLVLANPDGVSAGPAGADERDLLEAIYGVRLKQGTRFRTNAGSYQNRVLGIQLREPHRRAIARLVARGLARERNFFVKLLTFWQKQPVAPTAAAFPVVDHLWGIHDYVKLAEQDRFRVLQSPDGAEERTDPLTQLEILKLNEKLLPFAVLFNLEKEWMRQLDLQYRSLPPELVESLGTILEVVVLVGQTIEMVDAIGTVLEATQALEGVGAVFGGIGEALSSLDIS